MAERRKHPRSRCDLRVSWQRVHVDESAPGHLAATGPVVVATARDMSRDGLAFTTAEPLAVSAALLLSFERSFGGPPLSALGRVVRCERDPAADREWVVGVELTWIECTLPEQALGLNPESAWTLL